MTISVPAEVNGIGGEIFNPRSAPGAAGENAVVGEYPILNNGLGATLVARVVTDRCVVDRRRRPGSQESQRSARGDASWCPSGRDEFYQHA
jgi:hypothetical protein